MRARDRGKAVLQCRQQRSTGISISAQVMCIRTGFEAAHSNFTDAFQYASAETP
ncbi:hypothetical protein J2T09_002891 [Neorhizobium huautlense]|uniref:Uncharacterized protein n=1 Tax=Neorhizobium huautlense TaxID=67774 RepID=A0ABT9PUH4_9HYPH|nr:hypothetical protein [Neorhizobium huautlense]